MKRILIFFLLVFVSACAQKTKEITMTFQPKNKTTYSYEMKSDQLNINGILNADFSLKNDTLSMGVKIIDLSGKSNNIEELGYGEYIGNTYTRYYTLLGKTADMNNLPKQILNTDLFVVEFTKTPIKEGSKWNSKKTAKPEIFFDAINVEYVCSTINDNVIVIKTEMNFETYDQSFSDLKISRKLIGEYIVDRNDGSVISADFEMDLFTGFTKFKGTMAIRKL